MAHAATEEEESRKVSVVIYLVACEPEPAYVLFCCVVGTLRVISQLTFRCQWSKLNSSRKTQVY